MVPSFFQREKVKKKKIDVWLLLLLNIDSVVDRFSWIKYLVGKELA